VPRAKPAKALAAVVREVIESQVWAVAAVHRALWPGVKPEARKLDPLVRDQRWPKDEVIAKLIELFDQYLPVDGRSVTDQQRSAFWRAFRQDEPERPRSTPLPRSIPEHDVVGIGALNLDHVRAVDHFEDVKDGAAPLRTFEPGEERIAEDEDEITAELEALGNFEHRWGGSAFNVLRLLSMPSLGCRTGFVGVAGISPVPDEHPTLASEFGGCDTEFVEQVDGLAGQCNSILEKRGLTLPERSMLILPSVNRQLGGYIGRRYWELVHYLTTTRAIHVTSLLDDDQSPWMLVDLLSDVVTRAPDVTVSFDPGPLWTTEYPDYVEALLGLTNILFLNYKEFTTLSDRYRKKREPSDTERADLIRAKLAPQAALVVVKLVGTTVFYGSDLPDGVQTVDLPDAVLTDVRDDTGAGDVVAAMVLASRYAPLVTNWMGGTLGMALAREKVRDLAVPDEESVLRELRAITRRYPPETEGRSRAPLSPTVAIDQS
jgi:sugar/nucleoside kinase (ribokinase family)